MYAYNRGKTRNTNKGNEMKANKIGSVKVLKKGLRNEEGKYFPAHYSAHTHRSTGKKCVTVYAGCYIKGLPFAMGHIQNNTDTMTDYFETDKAVFFEGSTEYEVLKQYA